MDEGRLPSGRLRRLRQWCLRHQDTAAYLVWQIVSFALPVLVLGLAARRISPTAFGILAYAQGLASLMAKVAEFGFNIAGPRAIAIHHDDPDELTNIVSGITAARVPVIAVLAAGCLLAGLYAPYFREWPSMPLAVFLFSLWSCLHVMWYYQGAGLYRIAVLYETIGRLMGVGLMFLFIRGDKDAWMAIGFLALGGLLAQLGLALRIRRHFRMAPGLRHAAHWFHDGLRIFFYRIAEGFYSNAATLTLPFFVTPIFLGNFAAAEKVTRATVRVTYFIYGAAYPRFARLFGEDPPRAMRLILKVLGLLLLVSLCGALAEGALARFIVQVLMGRVPEQAVQLMRIMSLLVIPSAITVYACEAVLPAARRPARYAVQMYAGGCLILVLGLAIVRRQPVGGIFVAPIIVAEACMFAYASYLIWTVVAPALGRRPKGLP